MEKPYHQNFDNHVRIVPTFHYGVFGVFAINLIWSLVRLVRSFSAESVLSLLLAAALVLLFFHARLFALTVQDRIIRLEMRLRLKQLLPADLQPRLNDFTVPQLVCLRFAGDAELPELARKVLAESLNDRKTIKRLIQSWQPDFLRA